MRNVHTHGAITRMYMPDFIVITADGTRWIVEGKADNDMADPRGDRQTRRRLRMGGCC